MKVAQLETWMANAGLRNYLFVRLRTDSGLTGVGEASLEWQEKTVETLMHEWVEDRVIGRDPFDIEAIVGAVSPARAGSASAVMETCAEFGGALGIAVADRVAMMEFAWYSVISPEGCSGILWKGAANAADAAEALKLTSKHLLKHDVIDAVVPEPLGGAHRDPHSAAHNLEQYLAKTIRDLKRVKLDNLLERRYERFRNLGAVAEPASRRSVKAV